MKNRIAAFVRRLKGDRLVPENTAQLVQYIGIGARRKVRVGEVVGMIEHHTSGSFEESAFILVVRQVDNARDPESAVLQFLDDVAAALGSPAGGEHGIQHDRTVVMERDPIIRENGIRRMEFLFVLEDDHFHAGIPQAPRQQIELDASAALNLPSVGIGNLSLKQKRGAVSGLKPNDAGLTMATAAGI